MIAAAPFLMASSIKIEPSVWTPGSAKKAAPARIFRESYESECTVTSVPWIAIGSIRDRHCKIGFEYCVLSIVSDYKHWELFIQGILFEDIMDALELVFITCYSKTTYEECTPGSGCLFSEFFVQSTDIVFFQRSVVAL